MSCRIKGEVPRSAIQIPATVAEPPKPEAIKANGCIVDRDRPQLQNRADTCGTDP
jgi:hypothetical protein